MPLRSDYDQRCIDHLDNKRREIASSGEVASLRAVNDFFDLMETRHSVRVFEDRVLPEALVKAVLHAGRLAPQSCNRQAGKIKVLTKLPHRTAAAEMLVGGRGWAHKAPVMLLVFMDTTAYSLQELSYMPLLDAGVMLATMSYAATTLALGSCIINPNVYGAQFAIFPDYFNEPWEKLFGVMVLGYAAQQPAPRPRKPIEELAEWM